MRSFIRQVGENDMGCKVIGATLHCVTGDLKINI
jgi:hypothetical protein